MKLLVTAFDPFGGESVNAALEAAKRLPASVAGAEVVLRVVPTEFVRSLRVLEEALERERPDAVLCTGQAAGRGVLTPERVAINLDDARIPDNAGFCPVDRPIVPGGAPAYFSTLPVKAIAARLREAGVPCEVSNTAGTYVCNHLMYGLLDALDRRYPGVRGGFLHVPCLPEQAEARPAPTPSLPPETILRGMELALRVIAETA